MQNYKRNDLNLQLETSRVADLSESDRDWVVELVTTNMKSLYEKSSWGWNKKEKEDELMHENAWYLVARDLDSDKKAIGFASFRYNILIFRLLFCIGFDFA